MKIYHNPRCSKSRQALKILQEFKDGDLEVVKYLETPPDKEELRNILAMLDINPEELVRKNESEYKKRFKDKTMSGEEWIDAMIRYPKLIQRPIVIKGNKAVIGRPPGNVKSLF